MAQSDDWFFRLATVEDAAGTLRNIEDGLVLSGLITLHVIWYTPYFFHDRLSNMRLLIDGAEYARQPDGRSAFDSFGVTVHMLHYYIDTRRLSDGPHRLTMGDYGRSGQQVVRSESQTVVVANAPA